MGRPIGDLEEKRASCGDTLSPAATVREGTRLLDRGAIERRTFLRSSD
jgi:hypothetical protein